eukprot:TRINITY_DN1803_c0_g1_i2.p1 TRINITY_DN1803_c0_g1~~TRINITY_DN1803_c0_g1_i2.p1  ORF type:complete len:272 (-),score=39.71 TRINITY_DN1803_c0_g1_i2:134-949(-)
MDLGEEVSGWLKKQGPPSHPNWKKRWFILQPHTRTVTYYKNPKQAAKSNKKGAIVLDESTILVLSASSQPKFQHSFALRTPVRTFVFLALSGSDKQRWTLALRGVLAKLTAPNAASKPAGSLPAASLAPPAAVTARHLEPDNQSRKSLPTAFKDSPLGQPLLSPQDTPKEETRKQPIFAPFDAPFVPTHSTASERVSSTRTPERASTREWNVERQEDLVPSDCGSETAYSDNSDEDSVLETEDIVIRTKHNDPTPASLLSYLFVCCPRFAK